MERPILLPLSNPTEKIEVMPADAVAWTDGKALISVDIPVPPVPYKGTDYHIGQANNAMLYPGLGLGIIVSGASRVTDGMLLAAAEAVAPQINPQDLGASLLPPVDNLRASSATVAVAVAKQAAKDGVATKQPENWVQAVQDAMWQPVYRSGRLKAGRKCRTELRPSENRFPVFRRPLCYIQTAALPCRHMPPRNTATPSHTSA